MIVDSQDDGAFPLIDRGSHRLFAYGATDIAEFVDELAVERVKDVIFSDFDTNLVPFSGSESNL